MANTLPNFQCIFFLPLIHNKHNFRWNPGPLKNRNDLHYKYVWLALYVPWMQLTLILKKICELKKLIAFCYIVPCQSVMQRMWVASLFNSEKFAKVPLNYRKNTFNSNFSYMCAPWWITNLQGVLYQGRMCLVCLVNIYSQYLCSYSLSENCTESDEHSASLLFILWHCYWMIPCNWYLFLPFPGNGGLNTIPTSSPHHSSAMRMEFGKEPTLHTYSPKIAALRVINRIVS